MEETKIALLGLGLMGSGMAERLLDAGYPLSIWNRTPGKAQPLATAELAWPNRPAGCGRRVRGAQHAVGCPGMPGRVVGSRRGVLGTAPGIVLVESSTVTVEWIHELDLAAREHGCELVDAPVTGSKPQAEAGQLLFLAGGSNAVVEKITPSSRPWAATWST